jgi:hypothetical protein
LCHNLCIGISVQLHIILDLPLAVEGGEAFRQRREYLHLTQPAAAAAAEEVVASAAAEEAANS